MAGGDVHAQPEVAGPEQSGVPRSPALWCCDLVGRMEKLR
jgi:hypothetical protein